MKHKEQLTGTEKSQAVGRGVVLETPWTQGSSGEGGAVLQGIENPPVAGKRQSDSSDSQGSSGRHSLALVTTRWEFEFARGTW